MARQLDHPALIAAILNACSVLTVYDPETSRSYLDEAADLARASNDRPTLCETRLCKKSWPAACWAIR